MKYQVKIQYTNPAHEHVSLRRRVETITRLVEANNETEAINRAANQQRSLGFMIKEAEVLKPDVADKTEPKDKKKKKVVGDDTENTDVAAASGSVKEDSDKKDDKETKRMQDKLESGRMSPSEVEKKLKKESYPLLKPGQKIKAMKLKMKEGFDPEPSDIAAQLVKKHGKGKVTKDHVDAYERDRDSNKAIDKEAVMKHVEKMSEDVELDEAQKKLKPSYWKAEWRLGTQSEVDKNNKKIFDKLAKTDPVKASAFHDNLMRMKKKDVKEEVELDEANMRFDPEAAARPKSSDVKNFLNRDKNARASAASKKYIRRMTKLGGLGPNQTKKDTEAHMKSHFEEVVAEASKEGKDVMRGMRASLKSMDLRHGVDSDKREAGYKMSPAVKAAQAKSDALSKVVKRPQAGTIAAVHRSMERQMQKESVEYIEEKLTAADPAGKWISDFVASDNPKFAGKTKKERINMALGAYYAAKKGKNEEVDLDESNHEGKKESRKAGEKREDILQGKVNKINMTPELDQKINGVK